MAKQINEETKVTLDLKTIGMILVGVATVIGMWFALQADIEEAKQLPEPLPPDVTRMEFDMKDKNIRLTIENTQEDVTEIKTDVKWIKENIRTMATKQAQIEKKVSWIQGVGAGVAFIFSSILALLNITNTKLLT